MAALNSDIYSKVLTENKFIEEKVDTYIKILNSELEREDNKFEHFDYHHANVLVLCFEALALQDLNIKLGGIRPDDSVLQGLGLEILGHGDYEFVRELRISFTHKKIYDLASIQKMIKTDNVNVKELKEFFNNLLKYFIHVKQRISSIQKPMSSSGNVCPRLTTLFLTMKEILKLNVVDISKVNCADLLKRELACMLPSAYEKDQDGIREQDIEEVFYRLTVTSYAIVTALNKKQRKDGPLQLLTIERGELIHKFYETCLKITILSSRQHRMLNFLKKQRFQMFKLYFALIINQHVSKLENCNSVHEKQWKLLWTEVDGEVGADKILEDAKAECKHIDDKLHSKYTNDISNSEFKIIVQDYLRLMPYIDNVNAVKHRVENGLQPSELDGLDRREIYEEFLQYRNNEQIEKELQRKILAKGVTEEQFSQMFESFKSGHEVDDLIVNRIVQIKNDYRTPNGTFNIPDYRRLQVEGFSIDKFEEKLLGMFWDISTLHETTFSSISLKEIMTDPVFLQCLLQLTKSCSSNVLSRLETTPYFSPFVTQTIIRDQRKVHQNLGELKNIAQGLLMLSSSQSPIPIECLRNIMQYLYTKKCSTAFDEICSVLFLHITTKSREELKDFIGLLYVQFEWKDGRPCHKLNESSTKKLDSVCMGILLEWVLPQKQVNPNQFVSFLRIIKAASIRWFQYETNAKSEALDLLNLVIEHPAFQALDSWDTGRLEILNCKATLISKENASNKSSVIDKTLVSDSSHVLLTDYAMDDMNSIYKSASELIRQGHHSAALELYTFLEESIHLRTGSLDTNKNRITSLSKGLDLETLKIKIAQCRAAMPSDVKIHEVEQLSKFLTSYNKMSEDTFEDFRNLYDVAFNTSQQLGDHEKSYEMYQHLLRSILLRCGVTTLKLTTISYTELLKNSEEYKIILKELDYWDILRVKRDMGYELTRKWANASSPVDTRRNYENAINIYEEVIELEKCEAEMQIAKTLRSCAQTCYFFATCFKCDLNVNDKIMYLEKSKKYSTEALNISKLMYMENHPSVGKQRENLRKIDEKLAEIKVQIVK